MARTILVVDDDASARSVLQGILEPEGYDVIHAESGEHAVAAELVHVTATLVNEVNLFGKRFTDQSK